MKARLVAAWGVVWALLPVAGILYMSVTGNVAGTVFWATALIYEAIGKCADRIALEVRIAVDRTLREARR